ncbi:hypothetical protein NN561_017591 [Cricetulus griseus]
MIACASSPPTPRPGDRRPLPLGRVGDPGRDLASDPGSSPCRAVLLGCGVSCVRVAGLLPAPPPRELLPASPSLGEGALGGVERERPSGNEPILPPYPPCCRGCVWGNRPWLMMMI